MQQNTESSRRPSEALGELFDGHASMMLLIEPSTGAIQYANQAASRFYSYTQAELCAMRIEQLCVADPEHLALTQQRALHNQQNRFEQLHRVAGGDLRNVEVDVSPISCDGQPLLCAIIHDITERVRSEQALRQSELRYRSLIDALNVSVCRWQPDTTLVFTNEPYRAFFGIDGDPVGRQWLEFLPEPARTETTAFYRSLADNPSTVTYEHPVIGSDSQVRHYQWIDTPIFDAERRLLEFQSVGIDITDRRQAEEISYAQRDLARIIGATRSSSEAWLKCLEIAIRVSGMDSGGIYLFDTDHRELRLVAHTGLGAEFVAQATCYPIEAPNVQMILAGQSFYFGAEELEIQPLPPAEGLRSLASVPIHYQGRVVGCINLASHTLRQVPPFARQALETIAPEIGNIVVYLRTEEALRAEQLRFATVADSIPGTICTFLLRPDGTLAIPYASKAFEDLYGLTLDDVRENIVALTARVAPEQVAGLIAAVEKSARTLQPWRNEYRYQHPTKGEIWLEGMSMPVREADGSVVWHGFTSDISERKRAEQELREGERRFATIFHASPVGIIITRLGDNVMEDINLAAQNLFGYTREELIGHTALDVGLWAEPRDRQQILDALHQHQKIHGFESIFRHRSGELRNMLVSAELIEINGEPNMLFQIVDITKRKRAEQALRELNQTLEQRVRERTAEVRESEQQNRLLLAESPDAIVLFREDGALAQLNRAFEQLTGYRADQLLGQTMDSVGLLSHESVAQLAAEVIRHIQTNSEFAAVELRIRRASGEFRDVGVRVFGLQIRGEQRYLATMRDITSEKLVEETLRRANAELARAGRAKDDFLANMSHELRTPLNAILGLSEMLLEEVHGAINERQQKSLRNIEASGRHLLALINDILDLSKVEAGQLDLQVEPVMVAELCQTSLLFVKEQALKKSLRLAFTLNDQMAEMEADPRRIKQMLVNLLSNAVKFTPPKGQVHLDVDVDAEDAVIHFMVRDTGIGIAVEDLPRLFQPFRQLDSSLSRQHEGTGLGLALVRRLAELHGGSVVVESTPGQGSRFTISLPYRSPQPIADAARAPSADRDDVSTSLHSALVVEDSESAAEQLARYLHESSMRVFVHHQGEGALDQAVRLLPNVIFLDIQMPDRSGWDVLSQLKSNPRTRDIPVVIVSVVDNRQHGLAAGAAEYVVKPITREVLRRVLHNVADTIKHEAQQALLIVPHQAPQPPDGARILLVEDNEVNILTISDYLQARGYALSVARNGKEALSRIDEFAPELILMDIQMPEMDGLEATRRLRGLPAYAQTPIVALTALAMPGDRERCIQAGADEYLTKPVSLRGLATTIEDLLHR